MVKKRDGTDLYRYVSFGKFVADRFSFCYSFTESATGTRFRSSPDCFVADLSRGITPAFGYFMQVCGRFPLNPVFFIYIDESEVNTFEHHVLGFSCIFQFLFCFDEFPFVLFHLGNIPTGNQQQMTMTMGYDGFIYNRIMQNTIRGYVIFFGPVIFPFFD